MSDASAERLFFRSAAGAHVFLADGSRIYDLDDETMDALDAAGPGIVRHFELGGHLDHAICPHPCGR